ncbi:MAG TPA: hypothetical protein VJT75_14700 [Thermoleophilaceae bacterium]|nr:hypothetical protein [Thermoleophilaceae bacterium]
MRLRRGGIPSIAAAAVVALLIGPSADPLAKSGGRCEIQGRVITADSAAVIYRKGDPVVLTNIFVCVQKNGTTRKLGYHEPGYGGVSSFNLAGKYVAYIRRFCYESGPCVGEPHTRNVVSNKDRRGSPTPGPAFDVRPLAFPSGSLAWIRRKESTNEVHTLDTAGEHVVDAGPAVDPTSLARSGHTLYWTHDGEPRSAQVP